MDQQNQSRNNQPDLRERQTQSHDEGQNISNVLEQEGLGVCHWRGNGEVITQNKIAKSFCGDLEGKQCASGCVSFFSQQPPSRRLREGMHLFEGKEILGKQFDIVMAKKNDTIVSLVRAVSSESEQLDHLVEPQGLTVRENEIFRMRSTQRISVSEIAKKLGVSRATIRTHINNINKKLKNSFQIP